MSLGRDLNHEIDRRERDGVLDRVLVVVASPRAIARALGQSHQDRRGRPMLEFTHRGFTVRVKAPRVTP